MPSRGVERQSTADAANKNVHRLQRTRLDHGADLIGKPTAATRNKKKRFEFRPFSQPYVDGVGWAVPKSVAILFCL